MNYIILFLKGAAMGAANVIPGVSGGTIAFITGIYERLIHALRSFDTKLLRLVCTLRWGEALKRVDLPFLIALGSGVFLSLLTLGRVLKWLFEKHPVHTWAFFFGLILASIYFVGKMVKRWDAGTVVSLVFGVAVAAGIAFLRPASQNEAFLYLVLCGAVAMCSMIVPGLSGSFVLILLGNYSLVMLEAVPDLNFRVLVPVGIGAVVGLLAFARLLDWVFQNHHDLAVALLTGFVAGSLVTIWPWKISKYLTDASGARVLKDGEPKVVGYEWYLPDLSSSTWIALGFIVAGAGLVWGIEQAGNRNGEAVEAEVTPAS